MWPLYKILASWHELKKLYPEKDIQDLSDRKGQG